jgi:tryptophan-rich hypothetical protein
MAKKQKFPHLLGSKWTARQKILGWRHFQVVNRQNQGPLVFAEMVAACDPEVRLWVNAKTLKNHTLWRAGWQSCKNRGRSRPPTSPCDGQSRAASQSDCPSSSH